MPASGESSYRMDISGDGNNVSQGTDAKQNNFTGNAQHIEVYGNVYTPGYDPPKDPRANLDELIESLAFERIADRHSSIKEQHPSTCKWILSNEAYKLWQSESRDLCNRILWIKGKPGAGKSTIMKFIVDTAVHSEENSGIHIYFFFNARGESLEKEAIGLYRSLLFQLFKNVPETQKAFK
ncbi:hypothetical protein TWF718_002364 [Orbilia javanica]|uniref:Nephrocystin 3-like N-terminal domain-containing protein n=1 Tax=Orbilia javanica TaxID=47235 RepID=A0AAN8MMC2_9PEZI